MVHWVMKVSKSFSSLQAESRSVIATAAVPLRTEHAHGPAHSSCGSTQTQAAGRLAWGTCFSRGWCCFWLRMEVFIYKALIPVLGGVCLGSLPLESLSSLVGSWEAPSSSPSCVKRPLA